MHVLERPAPEPDAVAAYADHPCGVVDLFVPKGTESGRPLILIHGGFWRARYDRVHLRVLAAALAATGRRVALPEYRRVGDDGGGWPGSLEDVLSVLAASETLVGAPPDGVVLAGHSAGGHLAILAAARAATSPAGVVSLAGVLDTSAALAAGLSDRAVAALLGREAPTTEEIAEIDPMTQPLPPCEITVLHGVRDEEVPDDYSVRFAARAPRIRLALLDDADHYDLIDPLAPAYDAVARALA